MPFVFFNVKYICLEDTNLKTAYSSLIVKNIWWKKEILWNWATSENEIYLFFENNWLEKFIKINN